MINTNWNFRCIKIEFQKIVSLLDTTSDDKDLPKFVTKNCIEVYEENHNVNKEIRIKTPMLRADLHDFSDAYSCERNYCCYSTK